jgi:preprotein translocase subunit SecY
VIEGFQNAFRIPELKRRILFTLGILAVYRVGAHIPTPGIDSQALAAFFQQTQ